MALKATQTGAITGVLFTLLVIFTFLFGFSFDIVNPWEVGINFDTNTQTIDNGTVYPGGRYFVGVGHYFVRYPITFQLIEFSNTSSDAQNPTLLVNSNDGAQVLLDINLYYRMDETEAINVFLYYQTNLETLVTLESQDVIKRVCSQFNVSQFFADRVNIAYALQQELTNQIYSKFYCWIPLVQIGEIGLPDVVDQSVVDLVVASQNTQTAELNRQIVLIQQNTSVFQNEYTANQSVIINQANSIGTTLSLIAQANGTAILKEAEAISWGNFSSLLGFNSTQLVTYLFIEYLQNFVCCYI